MSERTIWRRVEKDKENTISGGAVWCHNLCCWLEPYTPPASWPDPRYDDPAKCGDPQRMILEWSQGAGGSSYWGCRAKDWTPGRAWLEQPNAPVPQKSEAEKAWAAHAKREYLTNPDSPDYHLARQEFIAGYEAKAAKGTP